MSRLTRLKASLEQLEQILSSPTKHAISSDKKRFDSWKTYKDHRLLVEWEKSDEEIRKPLLTEVLTYPLTLAAFPNASGGKADELARNVHVIGARAEASLPTIYWSQLLHELPSNVINLTFIGPEVPNKLVKAGGVGDEEAVVLGEKRLVRHYQRQLYPSTLISPPSCIVLFNPGLSHEKLQAGWEKTLRTLVGMDVPLLITGLNESDVTNDYKLLTKQFPTKNRNVIDPKVNPLAGMKEHSDGLTGRYARANHYVWGLI